MLKEIGKQKIIAISIGVLALIIILILLITDQLGSTSRFEGDYPVKVTSQKGGGLKITLDGSLNSDVSWEYDEPKDENSVISYVAKTSGSNITFTVTPEKTGYGTIKVLKKRIINEIEFPIADIYLDMVVSEKDGELVADFITATEKAQDGILGEADSSQPYYILGNYVYLPAAGDWDLLDATTLDPEDDVINMGIADNGSYYYRIEWLPDGVTEKDLVLKSESLGKEYKLKAVYNENNQIIIEKAE